MKSKHKKSYKYFHGKYMLVSFLWGILIPPIVLAVILIVLSKDSSFWDIFTVSCVAVLVIIINIIVTVLTRYKMDRNGITIDASLKRRLFIPWDDFNSVELTCFTGKFGYWVVELNGDDISVSFKTSFSVINAINEFSKDHETFNKLFSESVENAKQHPNKSKEPIDEEQLPDANDTKIFIDNEKRLALGGTSFHEIQYCVNDLPIKKLISVNNIKHWADDSLYIEALTAADRFFNDYYDSIFGQFGGLDYYGINYFTKEQAQKILSDLQAQDLPDKKALTDWLEVCVNRYNGFYFLGV